MNTGEVAHLIRHIVRLKRAGQLRFRAETFGLYYPAPQYAAPRWRVSPRSLVMLLRRAGAYGRWLREMEMISQNGGRSWWDTAASDGAKRMMKSDEATSPPDSSQL